jgi:hypothetical protein
MVSRQESQQKTSRNTIQAPREKRMAQAEAERSPASVSSFVG